MTRQIQVPALGESVTQAILVKWHKPDGAAVAADEPLCELETDKANVDIPSPAAGVVHHIREEDSTVAIGEAIATIEEGAEAPAPNPESATPPASELSPAVRRLVEENKLDVAAVPATGPGGRLTKQDVLTHLEKQPPPPPIVPPPMELPPPPIPADTTGARRVPMSKIRKRIAERLVTAQHTAAILTTFNEVDLSAVMDLRSRYKDRFAEVHGVSLGLMSFFARAVVRALQEFPAVNAFIEGDDVVYHDYVNLGIAVSTDRGLAVPVLRHAENLSFAKIESEIKRLAESARQGKLGVEELSAGTFTITNGGVFGSLLSTPILNPPQSAILGMHAIQKRPVAVNDKVEIRPMMYVALSYDHRLIDGRESVSFLVRVKQLLEDPTRLMLEI